MLFLLFAPDYPGEKDRLILARRWRANCNKTTVRGPGPANNLLETNIWSTPTTPLTPHPRPPAEGPRHRAVAICQDAPPNTRSVPLANLSGRGEGGEGGEAGMGAGAGEKRGEHLCEKRGENLGEKHGEKCGEKKVKKR